MDHLKQVILVRQDLKLPKGKTAVQVAHASVDATLQSRRVIVERWRIEGMKKVVLKVKNLQEMVKCKREALKAGLVTVMIKDAGLTQLRPGTATACAIGPADEEKIDKITGKLKIV